MSRSIQEVLRLSPEEKTRLGSTLERIQSVGEFLAKAASKEGAAEFVQAIEDRVPVLDAVGHAAAESLGPIKFVVKLFSKLTELSVSQLAYLACTVAYQRSIAQAVGAVGLPAMPRSIASGLEQLHREQDPTDGGDVFDLDRFSFDGVLQHPFVKEADQVLYAYAGAVGYSEEQERKLVIAVRQRFVANLKLVLATSGANERFSSLMRLLPLVNGEQAVYQALEDHAQLQRRLFEEEQVFGKEPFTLAQVYVEPDCGVLTWGEIRGDDLQKVRPLSGEERIDAFSEQHGGRHSMAEKVLELLGDPNLKDAIVIQGVAGAGKSAFTLWLCQELLRQGLRPIRVLLRDVYLCREITESLAQGIELPAEVYGDKGLGLRLARPKVLLPDFLFEQSVPFGGATICPFVLILDGWDEISLATAGGYRTQLERMLGEVRGRFLRWHTGEVLVRVILTGRPSTDVEGSRFLLKNTPILTIRQLLPERLKQFVASVAERVCRSSVELGATGWKVFSPERLAPAIATYQKEYLLQKEYGRSAGGPFEVLGLPLLAHLALRLLSHPEVDVEAVIRRPAALFRGLVDLTCAKAGKPQDVAEDGDNQFRVQREALRELLHWTAAAMTVYGQENIPFEELRLRMKPAKINLADRVEKDTEHNVLSQLMVSYFFKGGRTALGCEFLHKSFREYLFAEGIVELLKVYGRDCKQELLPRAPYWQEFLHGDPRLTLSRDLCRWLAPQWLTNEVASHLDELLVWEIHRSRSDERVLGIGLPTQPLSLDRWECIRDALADLWDWWAEGVHLRPQPWRDEKENLNLKRAYADELVEWCMPLDIQRGLSTPAPKRLNIVDSHLGDALFRMAASVHFYCAAARGWGVRQEMKRPWPKLTEIAEGPRTCQAGVTQGPDVLRLFSPGSDYFFNYVSRINSAGWRPQGRFPSNSFLRGVDLRRADLSGIDLQGSDLSTAILSGAILRSSNLNSANLSYADLSGASFRDADLGKSDLAGARLFMADLRAASLRGATVAGANFSGADLRGADTFGTDLSSTVGNSEV